MTVKSTTVTYVGIDPSTHTGFVRLDERGGVLKELLIESEYNDDVSCLVDIVHQVSALLLPTDVICVETPFVGKGSFVLQQGALGYMLRGAIKEKGMQYIDVAPSQLKKFISGSHLCKKEGLILPLYKKYKYENDNDNIRDAFGLAQIAKSVRTGVFLDVKQGEVVRKVLANEKPKR